MTINEAITAVLSASHHGDQHFRSFLRGDDPEVLAMRKALVMLADAVRDVDGNHTTGLHLEQRGRCAIVFTFATCMFDVVDLMTFGGPEHVGEYPTFMNAVRGADKRNAVNFPQTANQQPRRGDVSMGWGMSFNLTGE